ncbi:MAG: electron transfer flavoprotein subunit alpha/FixB family protein [Elusimicrobia bacterium]|nr:electron transfer flavoprotein subunit alpha/FixB family protein [Elusimicrobiota bacterium]
MPQQLSDHKNIWCFAEVRHGRLVGTIFELLTIGGNLAEELKEDLCVVLAGDKLDQWTKELFEAGPKKIYLIEHPSLANFSDEAYAKTLAELAKKEKPNKFLFPASTIGRSITGRLAVYLNTGAAADATELSVGAGTNGVPAGTLKTVRPTYGGNVLATVICPRTRPEIVSVRPMVFPKSQKTPGRTGETVRVAVNPETWKTKFTSFTPEKSAEIDLASADKIVSGGRGLGKTEGFEIIRSLANELGAAVGASRAAVDAGWIPYRHQVGLTGRTVRPKLYVACGISGQVQHLAGMGQADVICAINTDPECPMMKLATFSIETNLYEFIPLVIREIQKYKN